MKVFEIKGPIAAAILSRLMANAAEGEDVGCECPKCTARRAARAAEASPAPDPEATEVKEETWRDRALVEESDLNERISRLRVFLDGPDARVHTIVHGTPAANLSLHQTDLLHAQLGAMQLYADILSRRILSP